MRLIRTNLHFKDVLPVKEELTQLLFDYIPVGVGSKGILHARACVCICLRGADNHMLLLLLW